MLKLNKKTLIKRVVVDLKTQITLTIWNSTIIRTVITIDQNIKITTKEQFITTLKWKTTLKIRNIKVKIKS